MSEFVGVILAGGRGRRMGPLGEEYPKVLLPVANEPLIGHHLKLLHDLGARQVYVILGHRGDDVTRAIGGGERYGVTIHYVSQPVPLGSAHALGCVRPYVDRPVVVILGDYFFLASDPARLIRRLREGAGAMAAKREPDARALTEACALRLDETGRVLDIVEKPMVPSTDLKGCGFYALGREIFDAVSRTPRTALRDEYELSVSLELYIRAGHRLYAEEVIVSDTNFTRPEDVLECNMRWLERTGREHLISEDASIGDGVRLERTMVGHRAHIAESSHLNHVVVFPGAQLHMGAVVQEALVTPEGLHLVESRQGRTE